MAKDPAPPQRKLADGERVLVYLRRNRLENVLNLLLFLGVALLFVTSRYWIWTYENRMALLSFVVLLAVPIGIVTSTRYWLTDRRVIRGVFGVWTSWPLDGVAAARVAKGFPSGTVSFENAEGRPVVAVRAVDNAPAVLREHAGLRTAASTPPAAPPAESAEPASSS